MVLLGGSLDADRARCRCEYHVGSKNERPGRTGFAHLFEHMMFKGSKNVEPEAHTSFISSVGGQSNAYTTEDATVFWETRAVAVSAAGARGSKPIAWRRCASTRTTFRARARGGQGRAADARREPALRPAAARSSTTRRSRSIPYKHPVIGSMKDLEAASVEDVRDFYRTYYVPNNATLALVGDFDIDGRRCSSCTQYLGRVPKPSSPVPRDIPQEPPQTKEKRVTARGGLAAARRSSSRHHITYDGNPDSYPLHIASKILSGRPELAHLSQAGLRQAAWRWRPSAAATSSSDPNLFFAVAIVQPGHQPEDVEDALIAELDRTARPSRSSRHELQRAKNQFARDYIVGREIEPGQGGAARATPSSSTATSRRPTASSTSSRTSRRPTSSAWRRPTSCRPEPAGDVRDAEDAGAR